MHPLQLQPQPRPILGCSVILLACSLMCECGSLPYYPTPPRQSQDLPVAVWVSCTQTSTNTGEMRGMRDWGEWITKGVGDGVIRVSCYTSVTLLEHGRMRLRAQHVNKGGRPHLQNSTLAAWSQWASRVAPGTSTIWRAVVSPQGLLAFAQRGPACCSQGFPLPDLLPAFWPPSPLFSSSGSLTAVFAGRTMFT